MVRQLRLSKVNVKHKGSNQKWNLYPNMTDWVSDNTLSLGSAWGQGYLPVWHITSESKQDKIVA